MTDATRYPLSWPAGWKRTPAKERQRSDFKEAAMIERRHWDGDLRQTVARQVKGSKRVTMPAARERLLDQLERLGATGDWIVSTNVELTSYGMPRAGRAEPVDPGVAVYFQLRDKDRVLACDRWLTVAENIAAIAAHIDAIRRVDRYGVGTLDQAFAGYDALPPPGAVAKIPWRKVFEYADDARPSKVDLQARYRTMAARFHPDLQGGSHEAMAMLNAARDEALKEIG